MPAHVPSKTAQFQSLLPGHTQDGDQGMEELPSCFLVTAVCKYDIVSVFCQELEDLLDDDQDMEDMYLGRRRGEEAMAALQQMAYIAQSYSEGTQTDDADHSAFPTQVLIERT